MGYLVLARKYRPTTFSEVIGQGAIARTLENALRSGREAHAYLFTGPRGVGKTSMARILAKSLRCKDSPTATPCNECEFCVAVTEGRDLNVLEIDGASNRGIENIRDLRENVRYAPTQGDRKVYIVDEVHQITQDAFNAFLKTLEEPPRHVVFIFATTEPGKVPETIRSRCQEFEFRRIPDADIVAHLEQLAIKENLQLEPGMATEIARRARGGLRDALSLLDQLSAFGDGEVTFAGFRELTGYVAPDRIRLLFDAIDTKDMDAALTWVNEAVNHGAGGGDLLDGILDYCRSLLHRIADCADPPPLPGVGPEHLQKQREQFDEGQLLGVMQASLQCKRMLRDLDDERLALDMLVTELVRISELPRLAGLLQGLDNGDLSRATAVASNRAEKLPGAGKRAPTSPRRQPSESTKTSIAAAKPAAVQEVGRAEETFGILKNKLAQRYPSMLVILGKLQPHSVTDGVIWVETDSQMAVAEIGTERFQSAVRELTNEAFGQSLALRRRDPTTNRKPSQDETKHRQALDTIQDMFGGETVSE